MNKPKITFELVKVTPELARKWLEMNTANRPPSPRLVAQIADAIKAGRYTDNGVIEFGEGGELYDGQTRLQAVVLAGKPVWMSVKHNVSPSARKNIDTGRARKASDWLQMIGVKNATTVAAALRMLYAYKTGALGDRSFARGGLQKFMPDTAEDALKENPDVEEFARMVHKSKYPRGIAPSTVVAFAYLFSKKDYALALEFITGMADGFNPSTRPAFHKLREIIIRQPITPTPYSSAHLRALVVLAWNYERAGICPKLLRWSPGASQEFPEIK